MRKGDQKYQSKLKSFGSEANCQLFDIAACKCSSDTCTCEYEKRVPVMEKKFLIDQRTTRLMQIGGVDAVLML